MKYVIYILASLLIGCTKSSTVSRDEVIQDAVDKAASAYREQLLNDCYQEVLQDAQVYVDSIITAEISINDTVSVPQRPRRPELGKRIEVIDSVKVSPILEDNLEN